MDCKNCNQLLKEKANFCDNCGALVVTERISFKRLFIDFIINTFGVDSRFFLTMRKMTFHPDEVLNGNIDKFIESGIFGKMI